MVLSSITSGRNNQNFFIGGFFTKTNPQSHVAALVQENIEAMKNPLYSLDLVPRNFWQFPSLKRELHSSNLRTDAQEIQETQKIFGRILKEEFETAIKNGSKGRNHVQLQILSILRKKVRNVQPQKVRMMRVFLLFGGVYTTVFTKPAVTRDLFDVQTSVGAWKGNQPQNTRALSEFRQMVLQVYPGRMSTSFETILVHGALLRHVNKVVTFLILY